jgi:hypothetical protein
LHQWSALIQNLSKGETDLLLNNDVACAAQHLAGRLSEVHVNENNHNNSRQLHSAAPAAVAAADAMTIQLHGLSSLTTSGKNVKIFSYPEMCEKRAHL